MSTETNKATIAAVVAAKKATPTFGKATPAAAKKTVAKKTVTKKTVAKKAVKAANQIDATLALLNTKGKKGIHIDLLAEKLGETVPTVRRLIDQVRANRNRLVERTERCTFKLGGIRKA